MSPNLRILPILATVAMVLTIVAPLLFAQSQPGGSPPKEPEADAGDKLALAERQIAEKYKHLENVLLRMAEVSAATDPRRAALLKKAVAQSKDQLIAVRIERLVDLLGKDQLSRAAEGQMEVDRDLRSLLELLLSENRVKHIESEKARIREFLKQINGLIKQQKDVQARSLADDPKRLAAEQAGLADKTDELAQNVQQHEESKNPANAGDKSDASQESAPQEGNKDSPSEGEPKEKDKEKEDAAQPDGQQDPTHKRLEAAREQMKQAEDKLKEAQRQGAVEKQEEAIRELQLAKAKLEAILRQLREEEIGRMLAMLEARFRKMLDMQEEVYEGTVRLDKTPAAERTHSHEIESSRLSGRESQIVVEIDKTLLALRDDGSAAAFLEASQQIRDDMQQVVERLAQTKVGAITQNLEEDILTALKEMIEALKKAQKDQAKKSKQAGQSGQPQEPPLVDALAELKMIRALQMRVNSRTDRYSKLIEGEQADTGELVEGIRQLAERQKRIHQITRDLYSEKNQ